MVALAGFACADAVCASAPALPVLLLARMAAAFFAALYTPTAYAIAGQLAPVTRRGSALSRVAFGTTAATIIGVPLGALIGDVCGWRTTFMFGSALAGISALALALAPIKIPMDSDHPLFAARLATIRRAPIILSILATLLWSVSTYTVYTYVSPIFGARLELGSIALLLLAYGAGGLLGSQLGGWFIDRCGTDGPIIVAIGVGVTNLNLMSLTGATEWGAVAAFFVTAFATWVALLAQQSRLVALAPNHSAVVMSFLIAGIYVGSALGAALGGFLLARAGPFAPPYASAAASATGLALFFLSRWSIRLPR